MSLRLIIIIVNVYAKRYIYTISKNVFQIIIPFEVLLPRARSHNVLCYRPYILRVAPDFLLGHRSRRLRETAIFM